MIHSEAVVAAGVSVTCISAVVLFKNKVQNRRSVNIACMQFSEKQNERIKYRVNT